MWGTSALIRKTPAMPHFTLITNPHTHINPQNSVILEHFHPTSILQKKTKITKQVKVHFNYSLSSYRKLESIIKKCYDFLLFNYRKKHISNWQCKCMMNKKKATVFFLSFLVYNGNSFCN